MQSPRLFAYITNFNSNSVSVIDTATNTVVAPVPVGSVPAAFGQFIGQEVTAIPAMNEWGMIIFMALAGLGAVYFLRKNKRV